MDLPRPTFWLSRVERWLPGVYVLLALIINLVLCLETPPFFTPDEPHHTARVLALGHGEWMARVTTEEAGADIDANALQGMNGMDAIREKAEKRPTDFLNRAWGPMAGPGPRKQQARLAELRWAHRQEFAPFPNTAVYPPVLYLPAVVGWRLGEAADWTIFHSLLLARLLEALVTVAIGWVALSLCCSSRWLLFAYLLLPSALFLNASCAQDPVLLAVAGLLMAVLSRALVERRELTRGELGLMAVLLALCATARPPYLALALLLFLPGLERPKWNGLEWRRWVGPLLACACVVAVSAAWRHMVLPFGLDTGIGADPDEQYGFLREHPLWGAWYVAKGTGAAAVDLARRGLYVVGWNDLLAPALLRAAVGASWLALLLFAPAWPLRTWRGRGLLAVATLAPLLGISFAEYIIWTPPGGAVVYGVQPRYWLPVLPLLGMLVQEAVRPIRRALDQLGGGGVRIGMLLGALGGTVVLACTLPWVVAHVFYLESVTEVLRENLR